jgi:hypothetical protein
MRWDGWRGQLEQLLGGADGGGSRARHAEHARLGLETAFREDARALRARLHPFGRAAPTPPLGGRRLGSRARGDRAAYIACTPSALARAQAPEPLVRVPQRRAHRADDGPVLARAARLGAAAPAAPPRCARASCRSCTASRPPAARSSCAWRSAMRRRSASRVSGSRARAARRALSCGASMRR